jgi:hypothetical protein
LKVWSDYKARGAAYRVTDQKVADQAVEGGGLIPSRLADKHKNRTAKEKQESRMASPQGGDGVTALLRLPAGEVKNLGGLLARFERAFTNDPEGIQDLDEWYDWLYQVASGERGNPNVERAIRLFQDVFDFQESRDAA